MMTFAHPAVLLLLAAPIAMVVWELRRGGLPLTMPFDHAGELGSRWAGRVLAAASLLPPLLLAIAVLLLAAPQVPRVAGQEREVKNILFCLDVSGSMGASFGGQTRYEAAMKAIQDFTGYRPGDAFGLTIFGNEVLHWVPVTRDLSAIRMATPFLGPDKMPRYFGGTQIGKALLECRARLMELPDGDRMIILVSDGYSADLGGERTYEVGAQLRAEHIQVFTIHVAPGAPPADMQTITGMTGGEVFAADDPAALKDVFQRIDQMAAARLKPVAPRYADFFGPFALAGLVVLGLHQLAQLGLRYTPW